MSCRDERRNQAAASAEEGRTLILLGRPVAYVLRRSERKTLALRVGARGLRVGAPARLSLRDIEDFIHSHAAWVIAKLDARCAQVEASLFAIDDGAALPCLGQPWRLRLTRGNNRACWQDAERILELSVRAGADPGALLRRALQQRALSLYRGRVAAYCAHLGVALPAVSLTSARTRWGSCSRVSGIRVHWRLIHLAPELIDYVIAHEVAHLVEMNHSPRFWSVVASLYPAYRAARVELKAAAGHLPKI